MGWCGDDASRRRLPLARFHARLDPVDALDPIRRLNALDRIVFDVTDSNLPIDRASRPVRGPGNGLVAFTKLHHYFAARRIKILVFECFDDFFGPWRTLRLRL